mgnify:CR=1 FL=1
MLLKWGIFLLILKVFVNQNFISNNIRNYTPVTFRHLKKLDDYHKKKYIRCQY